MKYLIRVRHSSDVEINWTSEQAAQVNHIIRAVTGYDEPSATQKSELIRQLRQRFPNYIFDIELS